MNIPRYVVQTFVDERVSYRQPEERVGEKIGHGTVVYVGPNTTPGTARKIHIEFKVQYKQVGFV